MNEKLLNQLQVSEISEEIGYSIPSIFVNSLQIYSKFFLQNNSNKLCFIFPCRELITQWLTILILFKEIKEDYGKYNSENFHSLNKFYPGEKLLLNSSALVEWVGIEGNKIVIKGSKNSILKMPFENSVILSPNSSRKKKLSDVNDICLLWKDKIKTDLDKLLNIESYGNTTFNNSKIGLISKLKSFEIISKYRINENDQKKYFSYGKINSDGTSDDESAKLQITNNLTNLSLFLMNSNSLKTILIDGFNTLGERLTDFSDIDNLKIPTILITDFSEFNNFDKIKNYGFDFFVYNTASVINNNHINSINSPFFSFQKKYNNYSDFKINKHICINKNIERVVCLLHSIRNDGSNNDLNFIHFSLIKLINLIARISHIPTKAEISKLSQYLYTVNSKFNESKIWLGESVVQISEVISVLNTILNNISEIPTEKYLKLKELMLLNSYDYVICSSEDEAYLLLEYFKTSNDLIKPNVLSIADLDDKLLNDKKTRALLLGWPKTNNMKKLLFSFLFSEISFIFYQFEIKYFNDLINKYKNISEEIKLTLIDNGIIANEENINDIEFDRFLQMEDIVLETHDNLIDITDFELKLDNIQYSKYSAQGSLTESCKAKRIDFENNTFIYASDSHKFVVINEIIESSIVNPKIQNKKMDSLNSGDVIAFIDTDRDVLVELVDKNTNQNELVAVKKWTNLWKTLLRNYYYSIGNNFKKLVDDLRKCHCKKLDVTIKAWLQDDNRIGPDDDSDLISIAMLTNSDYLMDNIQIVRNAISQMTGWRMKAADFVRDKIKANLVELANNSIINSSFEVPDLGTVEILKVSELKKESENIDKKYVHRLLKKEIL